MHNRDQSRRLIIVVGTFLVAGLVGRGARAQSITQAYVRVVGAIQGVIQGDVQDPGHEGWIQARAMGLAGNVLVSGDSSTGATFGRRAYQPVSILKAIDRSTPKLMRMFAIGEHATQVIIEFYRVSNNTQEKFYTVTLQDAVLISVRSNPGLYDGAVDQLFPELLTFYFNAITWHWEPDGSQYQDTLIVPRQ